MPTTVYAPMLWPAWVEMWALAFSIYAALKLFTWWEAGPWRAATGRSTAYLLAWPGMDARAFLFGKPSTSQPDAQEWSFALAKFLLGLTLLDLALHLPGTIDW